MAGWKIFPRWPPASGGDQPARSPRPDHDYAGPKLFAEAGRRTGGHRAGGYRAGGRAGVVSHPGVDMVFFFSSTGLHPGGASGSPRAARGPAGVHLELGAGPVVVFDDATWRRVHARGGHEALRKSDGKGPAKTEHQGGRAAGRTLSNNAVAGRGGAPGMLETVSFMARTGANGDYAPTSAR